MTGRAPIGSHTPSFWTTGHGAAGRLLSALVHTQPGLTVTIGGPR